MQWRSSVREFVVPSLSIRTAKPPRCTTTPLLANECLQVRLDAVELIRRDYSAKPSHQSCKPTLMLHVGKCVQVRPDAVELIRRDYSANSGWETFLAYEDPRQDVLVGLLRLRQVSGRSDKERQPELRGRCGCKHTVQCLCCQ
jgi:hypothetical protein